MKQFKCSVLIFGCASLIALSCSKKNNNNNIAQYGPLLATSSSVTFTVRNCKEGENISCIVSNTNLADITATTLCPASGFTTADLTDVVRFGCQHFSQTTWSGTLVCSGSVSTFEPIEPTTVTNAPCPL